MSRSICVHGHFYQPPRENPLTGAVPDEPSASPFPNWNERIYDHCYRPNTELGNFQKISFNIGATLFRWLETHKPDTYQQIIVQEHTTFQLHQTSNAIAQPYYHIILPLASRQDKKTQIQWGLREYEHRFGHPAQGMWLPETAVDTETMEILAEEKVKFTILAPWQAQTDQLDITHPYLVELPSGNNLTVFFYEGFLSGLVSFDPPSTRNADEFVSQKLMPTYPPDNARNSLIMIASDGELYGHHQRFRDQFLSHLLDGAANNHGINPTFPSNWLKNNPVDERINIRPNTSWSCHHGVERWRNVCACGQYSYWKAPLRLAFNILAKSIDQVYLNYCQPYISNPWHLRDEYIEVMLGKLSAEELIQAHVQQKLENATLKNIETLLKAENYRMEMFLSDAWFFEEFDRIEPRNAVQYAAYATWLVKFVTGDDLSGILKNELAFTNDSSGWTNGAQIFLDYWQILEKNSLFL